MKKAILLLFLLMSLYIVDRVEAAEVLQSNGVAKSFSGPTVSRTAVKFDMDASLNIKAIRHTKYADSNWDKVIAYKSFYASRQYKGFDYTCPGYYMSRFYADQAGTQLIGWIRVYVAPTDLKKSSCDTITDTSKKVPDDDYVFNANHTSDLVVEPSKMIRNNLEIDSSSPVVRSSNVEDLVLYNQNMDSDVVNADKACKRKAASTGVSYQLRYNDNTKSWQCVVVNDCMYNSDLWYCNAQTFEQKYANVGTVVKNPSYEATSICSDATSSTCSKLAKEEKFTRYTREEIYVEAFVDVTNVKPTDTTPTFNSDPTGQYDTHDPNVVPPTPVGDSCWFPDGTPNFSVPGCFWNCDDPLMQEYSFCSCGGQIEGGPGVQPGQCSVDPGFGENGDVAVVVPDPEPEPEPDPDPVEVPSFGDEDNVSSGDVGNCAIKEICECIAALKPALEQIDSSVGGVGEKVAALNPLFEQIDSSVGEVGEKVAALNPVLKDIKNGIGDLGDSVNDVDSKLSTTNTRLSTINNSINGVGDEVAGLKPVLDQIAENTSKTTIGGFSIESNEDANLNELPDISNVLDENRPTEDVDRQDRYTFDEKVFEDQGDDTTGDYGKLAPIPEPKHWKGLLPDEAMPAQKELTKDTQMQRSKENEKDAVMQQSPQLQVDSMQKSPEMKVDAMQQSPQLQQQQLEQDEQYTRNHFYNQTNTNLGGGS